MTIICKQAGCNTQASFNEEGKKAIFCGHHAEECMVNVQGKRCKHDSCKTRAAYNHPGGKGVLFCRQHSEEGMVHVSTRSSVCKHPGGCARRSSCGYWVDGVASRCLRHKADLIEKSGLVINYARRCKVERCQALVNWGPDGDHPTHCNRHGAPRETDGFVRIPKKSSGRGRAVVYRSRRGGLGGGGGGGGGAAKKARKAQPRRVDTSSEESESEEEPEEKSDSSDDEEYEGEDDSVPDPEPTKKKRIIWL